jgi:hypothetical protein
MPVRKLTAEERQSKAFAIADLLYARQREIEAAADTRKAIQLRLKDLESQIALLASIVRSGEEWIEGQQPLVFTEKKK